jgi:HK97 family phage prohead protease
MHTKDFRAAVKAVGEQDGLEDGQFEAIVSVFGNEDSYGDVVMPGAFKADLERWSAKGDPLPVIWSHDWADPFAHLGRALAAEERPEGLWIRAQIDDLEDNPKAAQVYRLLKGRRVTQFSFAYDILQGGFETVAGREVYALRELKLHEVGPCLLGVNQETELLAVKAQRLAAGAKAGRVLSQKNYAALVAARDSIAEVIESAEPEKGDTPKTPEAPAAGPTEEPSQADTPPNTDEEPDGAKSDTVAPSAPRRALAVATITTL